MDVNGVKSSLCLLLEIVFNMPAFKFGIGIDQAINLSFGLINLSLHNEKKG